MPQRSPLVPKRFDFVFLNITQTIGPTPWCEEESWILSLSGQVDFDSSLFLESLSKTHLQGHLNRFSGEEDLLRVITKLCELLVFPLRVKQQTLKDYSESCSGDERLGVALSCRDNALLKEGILTSYNFVRWVYLSGGSQQEFSRWVENLAAFQKRVESTLRYKFTNHVIEEAEKEKIPYYLVDPVNLIYQLGVGSKGRLVLNSATDEDSFLGSSICNNKLSSHRLLSNMGVPTPRQIVINDPSRITPATDITGLPCVVKPLNQEQGRGVTPGLRSHSEILKAVAEAQRFGNKNVIIQEHIEGEDYRVSLIQGKISFIVKRLSPRVTGNGESTLRELVSRFNEKYASKSLSTISFEEDVKSNLEEIGLSEDSVPKKGEEIRLKKVSNLSQGGIREEYFGPIDRSTERVLEKIHKLLKLDYLGVDIICKDISKPLGKGNGYIIELNSMPDLISSRAKSFLKGLFEDPGESVIPTKVLILAKPSSFSRELEERVRKDPEVKSFALASRNKPHFEREVEKVERTNSDMFFTWYSEPSEVFLDRTLDNVCFVITVDDAIRFGIPVSYPCEIYVENHPMGGTPDLVKKWLDKITKR